MTLWRIVFVLASVVVVCSVCGLLALGFALDGMDEDTEVHGA